MLVFSTKASGSFDQCCSSWLTPRSPHHWRFVLFAACLRYAVEISRHFSPLPCSQRPRSAQGSWSLHRSMGRRLCRNRSLPAHRRFPARCRHSSCHRLWPWPSCRQVERLSLFQLSSRPSSHPPLASLISYLPLSVVLASALPPSSHPS